MPQEVGFFDDTGVVLVGAFSVALAIVVVVVYIVRFGRRFSRSSGEKVVQRTILSSGASRASLATTVAHPDVATRRTSVLAGYKESPNSKDTRAKVSLVRVPDNWLTAAPRCYGVDLGSHAVKVQFYGREGLQNVKAGIRPMVTVLGDGVIVDNDASLMHPDRTFLSVIKELADPASAPNPHEGGVVTCHEVEFGLVHGVAALLTQITMDGRSNGSGGGGSGGSKSRNPTVSTGSGGGRGSSAEQHTDSKDRHVMQAANSGPPMVAVSLPPYYSHSAKLLYAAAHAAGFNRFSVYKQSAALVASLLWVRSHNIAKVKPPRTVAFVDFGYNGISMYVCEVRESSGSLLLETHRNAGVQRSNADFTQRLLRSVDESLVDAELRIRVPQAIHAFKEAFAKVPDFVSAQYKMTVTKPLSPDHQVELERPEFLQLIAPALADVERSTNHLCEFLKSRTIPLEDVELHLTGGGFKLYDMRKPLENAFDLRHTHIDRISIAQGLALLGAMAHPAYQGQKFDIYPLFELPTVDETGARNTFDNVASNGGNVGSQGGSGGSQVGNSGNGLAAGGGGSGVGGGGTSGGGGRGNLLSPLLQRSSSTLQSSNRRRPSTLNIN